MLGVFISDPVTDIVSEAIVSARLMLSPSVWNQNCMHQEKDAMSYLVAYLLLLHRNFVAMKYFRNVSMFDNRGSTSQGLWWRNDKLSCWDFSMKECILDGWGSLVTYSGDKWISLISCAASTEIRYAGTETEYVNMSSDLDNIMITFISKIIESNVQFLWLCLNVQSLENSG